MDQPKADGNPATVDAEICSEGECLADLPVSDSDAALFLRSIFKVWPDYVYFKDTKSRFKLANTRVAHVMGAPDVRSLIGKTDLDYYPPSTAKALYEAEQELVSTPGAILAEEQRLETPSGEHLWLWTTKIPVCDHAGDVIGLLGLGRDITRQKDTELAVQIREHAIQTAPNCIMIAERHENGPRVIFANAACTRITGVERDALIGKSMVEVLSLAGDNESDAAIKSAIRAGEKVHAIATAHRKDGTVFWEDLSGAPVSASGSDHSHYVCILKDITEHVQAKERIDDLERLESLGGLTGGVAHEFNNVLMSIMGNLDTLEALCADKPKALSLLRLIGRASDRGASLTSQLLAFSRRQVLQPEVVDVNAFVADVSQLLARTIGDQNTLSLKLSPTLWRVHTDPTHLQTAIVNLVVNAADAMPDGGTITIETENTSVAEREIGSQEPIAPGEYVRVSVIDTGAGMSPDVLGRALEPFYTTKPVGKGTGLGLSLVYGFAKQSGGNLSIYSEEGHGACIRLYLPRATGEAVAPADRRPDQEAPRALSGAILVVEDDDDVRDVLTESLRHMGLSVRAAANGVEAKEIIARFPPPDVILSDVVMPGGMSGLQLLHSVRKTNPSIACILSSGYSEKFNELASEIETLGAAWIGKPYHMRDLAKLLHRILPA